MNTLLFVLLLISYVWCTPINNIIPCTYSQLHWLNDSVEWPNFNIKSMSNITKEKEDKGDMIFIIKSYYDNKDKERLTICGVSWRILLKIDTIKMAIEENMFWMLSFHQLSTTILNIAWIQQRQISNFTIDNEMIKVIIFIIDELERSCNNMNKWPLYLDYSNTIYSNIDMLRSFNNGIIGPGQCLDEYHYKYHTNIDDEYQSQLKYTPFYFYNSPDLIIMPLEEENHHQQQQYNMNNTYIFSLLKDDYRYRMFLFITDIFAYSIIIPLLAIMLILLYNRRKEYFGTINPVKYTKYKPSDNENTGVGVCLDEEEEDVHDFELNKL